MVGFKAIAGAALAAALLSGTAPGVWAQSWTGRNDAPMQPAPIQPAPSQTAPSQTAPSRTAPAPQQSQAAPQDDSGQGHHVRFLNKESARITSIYISSSSSDEWGDDLMGSDELDPGSTKEVVFKGPCRADVKIDFEGGAEESRRFVDVCKFKSLTIEPGWTLKALTPSSEI